MNVERIGTTRLLDSEGNIVTESDRYEVTVDMDQVEGPIDDEYIWTFDGISIGCPNCLENTKAIIDGGVYRCYCGYENDFDPNSGTLRQAATLGVDDRVRARVIERTDEPTETSASPPNKDRGDHE